MVVSVVVGLLGRSRKFQAIKELRRATGLGLADAKALIEAIQSGHRPPATVIPGEAVDVSTRPGATQSAAADPGLAERARSLRATGRETEAIRLVCDETGMAMADAAKFVRSLD
jgi:ribosomal protein L7/L12